MTLAQAEQNSWPFYTQLASAVARTQKLGAQRFGGRSSSARSRGHCRSLGQNFWKINTVSCIWQFYMVLY